MRIRLGILASHPIQYQVPWFRYLAKRMEIEVFYAYQQNARGQAEAGFGVEFDWDIPLLNGYPHRWLKNVARHPSLKSFNGCDTPEIYEVIQKGRFDAFLILGWNRKSFIQAIRACWENKVPILMRGDSHLQMNPSRMKSMIKYLPYRWFLPRLNAHLYVGERNRDYLRHYGVGEEKLFFCPHFVDSEYLSQKAYEAQREGKTFEIRSRFGIPKDAFLFLFVGKMTPVKNVSDFIRACIKVVSRPDGSNIHALLVGDGPLRKELEPLARPYSNRIHFAGFCNQSGLPSFYRSSNALVLPSRSESWGLVVNEAFASGIPAIVSDTVGCVPDMIEEGRTGFTYPMGNVEALRGRMLSLKSLCEQKSTLLRQALSEKMARYSVKRATEGLTQALSVMHSNLVKPKLRSLLSQRLI